MWSDTLLLAERAHVLRLVAWGAVSAVLGTAVLAMLSRRPPRSALLWHFAIQTAAWGTAGMLLALTQWSRLGMRDLASATRLDRAVWFGIGLDLGIVGVGVAVAVAGWMLGKRLGAVGAGVAIVVQGLALAVLGLYFTATVETLV